MSDSQKKHDHKDDMPGRAIVATFESREEAKRALGALHKAHFTKTWFGSTSVATTNDGDEKVTAEPLGGSGFFSSDAKGLVDVLVAQDVLGETARRIEADTVPGCAIVTVRPPDDDKHDPADARAILQRFGGRLDGRSLVGAATGGSAAGYTSAPLDEAYDDSLTWEEETFYHRN